MSAVIAALGGFLFGFDTVVISGAEQQLEQLFAPASGLNQFWSKFWHGFLMVSALIGTVIGSVAVGKPADIWGRRNVMFVLAMLYLISAAGSAMAWDWYSLWIFRFIGGLGVGGASVVSPMYIAEIAPARSRGRLVAMAQFNIVLGILVAFLSNYAIAALNLDAIEWRVMLGVEVLPAIAYFGLLFLAPLSPRWLIAKGRPEEARGVLSRIHAERDEPVDEQVRSISESIDNDRHALEEPFFQRKYLKPILLAFAIAAFNQLSGINAILYYSRRIFESVGFEESAGLLNSVGLGLVNLIFTMLGLVLIDRFGRKNLMLFGSIGYIVSLGITALMFFTQTRLVESEGGMVREFTSSTGGIVVFVSLLVFIASHAVGQGAVIWVFISEIFPNSVRARGQAFGSFTHWVFAAVISQTFPLIADLSGGFIFLFYTLCMVGQLAWVLLVMPETKGVVLEDVQKKLGIE